MAQCMIFEEDEISLDNESGLQYALVVESSEFVSSDEDDEDNTYWDRVKRGTLRVAWHPDGEEEIVPESQVKLADRSLMPGDVVRRLIAGQDSQRGYVRNTTMYCYLQVLGKPKVICDVDSRDLQFLEFWDTEPGDVYLDSWVGKILKVSQLITLKFSDGARTEVEEDDFYTELSSFEDIHEKRDKETEFAMSGFYPGQRLKGYLSDLQKVKWLVTTKQHSPETAKKAGDKEVLVTVDKVIPKVVDVHWLCQGFARGESPDKKVNSPSSSVAQQDLKRLRKLDCFEATSVQLGDKVFYVLKESDLLHNIPHKGNKTLVHHVRNKLLRQHSATEVDKRNAKNALINTEEGKCGVAEGVSADQMVTMETSRDNPPDTMNDEKCAVAENMDTSGDQTVTMETCPSNAGDTVTVEESHDPVQRELEEYISDAESNGSAASTQSVDSGTNSKKKKPVHKKGGALPTKILKKRKLKKSKRKEDVALWEYKPGDRVASEVIYTYSRVEVMWQDGTIETDIPSTELYPIHHLDELEFFPGDYVIPSSNTDTSHLEYGVVSRVDHAGRTCMVTWFKSNEMGLAETPIQSANEEEVSVYDIKDHVDYKFRPGRVVVRVGGYETGENLVAAGQVFELCTDGRLHIQWADESRSYCYPQELYLIGEDLSELNSDLDSDLESSDVSSDEESWETEEEEEVCEGESEEGVSNLSMVKRLTDSAGKLFDVVITSLQNLEELFSLPVVGFCQMKCFREVLKLYKSCREVDRKLNASYFDDSKLRKVISQIKSEMRKEQQKLFSEKIQELIERNMVLRQGGGSEGGEGAGIVGIGTGGSEGDEGAGTESSTVGMAAGGSEGDEGVGTESSTVGISTGGSEAMGTTESGGTDTAETGGTALSATGVMDTTGLKGGVTVEETTRTEGVVPDKQTGRSSDINGKPTGEKGGSLDTLGEDHMTRVRSQGHEQGGTKKEEASGQGDPTANQKTAESCDPHECGLCGEAAASNDSKVEHLAKLLRLLPESLGEGVAHQDIKSQLSQIISKDLNLEVINIGKLADQMDQSTQTSGQPDCGKCTALSRELCQQACHLLREIVIKIQEDLGDLGGKTGSKTGRGETCDHRNETVQETSDTQVSDEKTDQAGSVVDTTPDTLKLDLPSPSAVTTDTDTPMTPQTPAEIRDKLEFNEHGFSVLESAPSSHKYKKSSHQPTDIKTFTSSYRKELKLLHTSLPLGIFVKGFEERMDLFSVMIHGPLKTPYEDGLFFFDVRLPEDFPNSPPCVHYIAYCTDRLNPNLYEDGTVCVSLLGTWQGKGTEVWTKDSSLLQILISLQGLILVSEPYYNEAGYEKQKGSQQGQENSRMYNEMALLKMVQSVTKMAVHPPEVFYTEVIDHITLTAHRMLSRLEYWLDSTPKVSGTSLAVTASSVVPTGSPQRPGLEASQSAGVLASKADSLVGVSSHTVGERSDDSARFGMPEFPLLPVSKGFALTLRKNLNQLRKVIETLGIVGATVQESH